MDNQGEYAKRKKEKNKFKLPYSILGVLIKIQAGHLFSGTWNPKIIMKVNDILLSLRKVRISHHIVLLSM